MRRIPILLAGLAAAVVLAMMPAGRACASSGVLAINGVIYVSPQPGCYAITVLNGPLADVSGQVVITNYTSASVVVYDSRDCVGQPLVQVPSYGIDELSSGNTVLVVA